jgi:hypothetical protein
VTDDIAGVLAAPICTLLSSSLTELTLRGDKEVERFTEEQEEALQLLTSLEEIQFWVYDKLQGLPARLHRLPNFKKLAIYHCAAIRSLPKDGLPRSLQELGYMRLSSHSVCTQGLPPKFTAKVRDQSLPSHSIAAQGE